MTTTTQPRRKADGRETLLDVARTQFLANGFDGVSMQQVAEAAGMTKGAPYYHFKSKDDLFLAVFVREVTRLGDGLTEALEGQGSLRDRLKVGVRGVIESTTGDFDQLVRDFDSHFGGDPTGLPDNGEGLDLHTIVLPFFQHARESGEYSRLSAEQAVDFFMLVLLGQSKATKYAKFRHRPTPSAAERASELIDLLFDGI